MSWVTGVAVYFVVWWISLFMVLPWGNRPDETPAPGNAPSAPKKPRIWWKFGATTILAAVIWGVIYLGVTERWIDFRA